MTIPALRQAAAEFAAAAFLATVALGWFIGLFGNGAA